MSLRVFDESARKRIEAIVYGTLRILSYNKKICFLYERIGEGTFTNALIGAVNRPPATLVVNIDWYENAPEEDVKMILRHEARHLYQWSEVEKLKRKEPTFEKKERVEQWAINLLPCNYIANTPGNEIQYFQQPCELDAYIFAIFLMNVEQFDPDEFVITNVDYPGIGDIVFESVVRVFQSTPLETLIKYREHFKSQVI